MTRLSTLWALGLFSGHFSGLLWVGPAAAGTWGATRTLEGPFAVSSPPDAPQLAMSQAGEALVAWNATGRVRFAEKLPGRAWSRSVTGPGGGFGPATELAPGAGVWTLKLGIDCDGSVTLLWQDGQAIKTRHLPGVPGTDACTGQPGSGPWAPAEDLSDAQTAGGLPDMVVHDDGPTPGNPNSANVGGRIWQ